MSADDALSDDMIEPSPVALPPAELKYLPDILEIIRQANATQMGREGLTKFLLNNEYLKLLIPLVSVAEDLESLEDLHRLCDIMKQLIVLNDNSIIELMISDENVMGVVGALECEHFQVPSCTGMLTKSRRFRFPDSQSQSPAISCGRA